MIKHSRYLVHTLSLGWQKEALTVNALPINVQSGQKQDIANNSPSNILFVNFNIIVKSIIATTESIAMLPLIAQLSYH